jgi:hypothetical protein
MWERGCELLCSEKVFEFLFDTIFVVGAPVAVWLCLWAIDQKYYVFPKAIMEHWHG